MARPSAVWWRAGHLGVQSERFLRRSLGGLTGDTHAVPEPGTADCRHGLDVAAEGHPLINQVEVCAEHSHRVLRPRAHHRVRHQIGSPGNIEPVATGDAKKPSVTGPFTRGVAAPSGGQSRLYTCYDRVHLEIARIVGEREFGRSFCVGWSDQHGLAAQALVTAAVAALNDG